MQLNLAGTANDSIVEGPGLRYTIFVQGCPHHCEGCHNPQTHAFDGGTPTDLEELLAQIRRNPLLDGVTFSGGEPFCQAGVLAELGRAIHAMGLNIVTYTGYTFEALLAMEDPDVQALLAVTDWLIDGPFIQSQQSYQLHFRGSANQRILDCQASLQQGTPVETEL